MALSREQLLSHCVVDGLWQGQIRSTGELSALEIAEQAVAIIPGIPAQWRKLCTPFVSGQADYDRMDDENSLDWIYNIQAWMDPIFDVLPLKLPATRVYRLQDPNGDGVFHNGVGLHALTAPVDGCPQTDRMLSRFVQSFGRCLPYEYRQQWFFGCDSFGQLQHWLQNANIAALEQKNISVGVYEVSNQWCVKGESQSLFQRHRAQQIDCIKLETVCPSARKLKL